MPRYPSFVGPSYTSQSPIADAERCVNWYPERVEAPAGQAQWVLYPAPGFELFCTLPNGPIRGFFSQNGRTFAVGGGALYELFTNGTFLERGTGLNNLDDTPVTIHSNGDGGHQLFITSGSKGYVFDLSTNTLTFVLDNVSVGGFVDGFFLALDTASSTLKISELEDGSTWDPLQIAQRNAGSDRWAAMLVSHKEIWLFGTQTSEVFYNSGASPFPFVPNPSVFLETGIVAPASAAILDNAPMWLGQNTDGGGIIYRANGYTPQRVSNFALEHALAGYSTLLDARAWSYQEQGHSFYVLTFPTAGATWVYDASNGAWHERGDWNGFVYTGLPVQGHVFAFGKHLTGDRVSAKVYRMGVDIASDAAGQPLRRLRRAPHLSAEGARYTIDNLRVELEAGLGLTSGQGADPQLMLRQSADGGKTWGNERWVSVGKRGQYRARAKFWRLGQARDRVVEIAATDPIPWRIIDCFVNEPD